MSYLVLFFSTYNTNFVFIFDETCTSSFLFYRRLPGIVPAFFSIHKNYYRNYTTSGITWYLVLVAHRYVP